MTAIDIIVLLGIAGAAVLGFMRGFVTEVLALLAWLLVVVAIKFLHAPLTGALAGPVGTISGASVLAFAILAGATYFGGRMIARSIGARTRDSFLGPIDRALGLGFGALKGLILASLAFLLLMLVIDTVGGGRTKRPEWVTSSTVYPLLDITSRSIADVIERRRKGEPLFGEDSNAVEANLSNEAE